MDDKINMKILTYLNTNKNEVESKKYNIWVGISLGNRFFTRENIKKYLEWALEYTKNDVLVVIGDRLQAINFEVLDKHTKIRALKNALKKGDEKEKEIREILSGFPREKRDLVKVVRFKHVTASKYHDYRLEVLHNEFKTNQKFHEYIIKILKENKKVLSKDLSNDQLDKLAEYILQEIPVYLNGAKYGGTPEHGGKTYLLQIYPGIGLIDSLLMALQEGVIFPELTKSLKITDKIAIIEGYPE